MTALIALCAKRSLFVIFLLGKYDGQDTGDYP